MKKRRSPADGRDRRVWKAIRQIVKRGGSVYMPYGYHLGVFQDYFRRLGHRVDELRETATRGAVGTFLSILNPPREFRSWESVDILTSLRNALEDRIATTVSRHSVYYWVHLYRRLAPENTFGHTLLSSVMCYREVMEAAFMKYGRQQSADEFVTGDSIDPHEVMSGEVARVAKELGTDFHPAPGVYIREFGIHDFVELLSLERLTCELCQVLGRLRRAHKGGRLHIEGIETYYVTNDEATESLIESFDERNERLPASVTSRGIPIGRVSSSVETVGGICVFPAYNVQRLTLAEHPQDRLLGFTSLDRTMSPNFVLAPVDMSTYYLSHEFLSSAFAKKYGFPLECFIQCMTAVARIPAYASRQTHGVAGSEFMQRAYFFYPSLDSIVGTLQSTIGIMERTDMTVPRVFAPPPTEKQVRSFLKTFALDDELRESVDLATRGPRPLIVEVERLGYLMDFSASVRILVEGLNDLDEVDWTEKGIVFEDSVIETLAGKGFSLWERQKTLKGYDGTDKEVDLSFLLGTALFACDCCSVSRSRAFERGEKKALDFRRQKLDAKLERTDEQSVWLSVHREGHNFRIPDEVNMIIPVVVSPFVEYIWSSDGRLWLTDRIPRVCTPGELASITRDMLSEVAGKPFVRYVL